MTKREVLEAALRGEGELGRCADDEPVFVLVARDRIAARTIDDWTRRAYAAGVAEPKILRAVTIALAFDLWREAHGDGKLPD